MRAILAFCLELITAYLAAQEVGVSPVLRGDLANVFESAPNPGAKNSSAIVINWRSGSMASESSSRRLDAGDAPTPQIDLPDNPSSQSTSAARPRQTKRILGVIPNFRAVSTNEILPPQSIKEKLLTTTQDSFDYSAAIIPAALAGYSMARKSTPEFGAGTAGYGRYFWHAAVDQTSENYMVEFIFPVLTREDSRYYTLGNGSLLKRTGYALSRAVITRSDSGRNVFNVSEVAGAGASATISNLYYPAQERTAGNTATEWGLDVGIDAITLVLKEFWPDINHSLFHLGEP